MIDNLKETKRNTQEQKIKGRKWYTHTIWVSFDYHEKQFIAEFTIKEPYNHKDYNNYIETRVESYTIYQNGQQIHSGNSHGATQRRSDPLEAIEYYLNYVQECCILIDRNMM